VDELGKLEVEGKGLAGMAHQLIEKQKAGQLDCHLLFIVRESLLEEVVNYFGIGTYHPVSTKDIDDIT